MTPQTWIRDAVGHLEAKRAQLVGQVRKVDEAIATLRGLALQGALAPEEPAEIVARAGANRPCGCGPTGRHRRICTKFKGKKKS